MSAAAVNDDRTEQAAWKDLLDSPGWDRLVAHVKAEYEGPAFATRVEELADNPNDPSALSKLRQLLAAKRAVMRLLALPQAELARVKRLEHVDGVFAGRRGRL